MTAADEDSLRHGDGIKEERRRGWSSSRERSGTSVKRRTDISRKSTYDFTEDARDRSLRGTTASRQRPNALSRSPSLTRHRSRSPRASHRRRSRSPRRRRYDSEEGDKRNERGRGPGPHYRQRQSRSPLSRDDETPDYTRPKRKSRSRSRSPKRRRRSYSASKSPPARSRKPLPSQDQSYQSQHTDALEGAAPPPVEKEKPNFKTTGLLAAETNRVTVGGGTKAESIVLKYHEPPEARKPPSSEPWNLYVFKGTSSDPLQTIPLYSRSCWLLGRENTVCDIPVEHPSCSKQHAVFQFRHVTKKDEWGQKRSRVKLYLLDLESGNGTMVNGEKVEGARYVECRSGDIIKLGHSEREYVLLLPPKA